MGMSHSQANSSMRVGVLTLAVGLLFAACTDEQAPISTALVASETSTTIEPSTNSGPSSSVSSVSLVPAPDPVSIAGVYEAIDFYPACGNETLDHRGVTWFPIVAAGGKPLDPALQPHVDEILAVDREMSPVTGVQGIVRVVEPGPGDDIGTLVVWEDGVARWVSDSRDLDVWMIDDEIRYMWVC
jgi:hypothetical protein